MRKRVSASRRLERGRANDYFNSDNIKTGDLVVLACRVSQCEQNRTKKLQRQVVHLRQLVKSRGAKVIAVFTYVGSGTEPFWFGNVADEARENGAKIVFETPNRAIRHPAYHSESNFEAQARTAELDELRWCTQRVELVTILDPDATASDERSFATRRGQSQSGTKGGRPKKRKSASQATIVKAKQMRQ